MNEHFELTACPLCGGEKYQEKLRAPDRFNLCDGSQFRIVSCADCGCVFLNPRPKPADLGAFYREEAYQPFLSRQKTDRVWDLLYRWARFFTVRGKRRRIERLKPGPGKLLDVGCGTGEFLHEMQRHGWQVAGIEQDEEAAAFARRTYGLEVETGDVGTERFSERRFDVVTFWHVLEHLHRPVEVLKNVRERLAEDGLVLVAAPNIGSPDAGFYGAEWVALDAPRHLVHFTEQSMRQACERAGLRVVSRKPMPLDAVYNCLMSERLALEGSEAGVPKTFWRYLRGVVVAARSVLKSTPAFGGRAELGSSILYLIRKEERP